MDMSNPYPLTPEEEKWKLKLNITKNIYLKFLFHHLTTIHGARHKLSI